jgi:hypothetical protein
MVYEAWLAMNETMAEVARHKQYDDWRLFQLAFILANLPSLVTRDSAFADLYDPKRDDTVTLLYFATGGGKSEAFLGLLSFALFFDRLRGKSGCGLQVQHFPTVRPRRQKCTTAIHPCPIRPRFPAGLFLVRAQQWPPA